MRYLIILLIVPALFSCNTEEVERLRYDNEMLRNLRAENDSSMQSYLSAFNEIEENLQLIKEKEAEISVTKNSDVKGLSQKERINDDLRLIYNLMDENRQKLKNLQTKLNSAEGRNVEFKRMLDRLNRQLAEKDTAITLLKTDLQAANIKIDVLEVSYDSLATVSTKQADKIDEQGNIIQEQTYSINTAYFTSGTFQELKQEGVVTAEGGFIGIGRTKTLIEDFNKGGFTKIDVTKTNSIPIMARKIQLITTHPTESYKLEETDEAVEKLVITDPKKFWEVSRYLVVMKK